MANSKDLLKIVARLQQKIFSINFDGMIQVRLCKNCKGSESYTQVIWFKNGTNSSVFLWQDFSIGQKRTLVKKIIEAIKANNFEGFEEIRIS